jgi:NAD-dependent SIR2 family protein deacetylase
MLHSALLNSPQAPPPSTILELHGTLAKVHCLQHRHDQPRDDYQEEIARLNPIWDEGAKEAERTGQRPRTNPDGDVELHGVDYTSFQVPTCKLCEDEKRSKAGIVKPNVVFFVSVGKSQLV